MNQKASENKYDIHSKTKAHYFFWVFYSKFPTDRCQIVTNTSRVYFWEKVLNRGSVEAVIYTYNSLVEARHCAYRCRPTQPISVQCWASVADKLSTIWLNTTPTHWVGCILSGRYSMELPNCWVTMPTLRHCKNLWNHSHLRKTLSLHSHIYVN